MVGERSLGGIVQDVMRDASEVVRGEVRLAKAEVSEKVGKAGKAAGLFGGAAVAGLMGLAALIGAGIAGLALIMPLWMSAALVGILLAAIGGILYALGKTRLTAIDPVPERTVQTIKDDVQWAKHRTT
jgi:hypothetical protein